MDELVYLRNDEAVCSSLQVAEKFEKRHDNVMRSIEGLLKNEESLSGRKKKRYMDLTECRLQSMWRTRSAHVSSNRQSR